MPPGRELKEGDVLHPYQWPQTKNAVITFCNLFRKYRNNKEELELIFLKTPVYATEKLDGTNKAKDDTGQMYARRIFINDDVKEWQKTSLDEVRTADVARIKTDICKYAGLDEIEIEKLIVYGELVCNHFYDYNDRDLFGKWKVFGAMVVAKDLQKTYKQLEDKGFTIRLAGAEDSQENIEDKVDATLDSKTTGAEGSQENNENKVDIGQNILILPNKIFFDIVKPCGIEVANVMGEQKSIFDIVAEHKDVMMRGKLEGIIFTLNFSQFGGQVIKWKGAQEYQPNAFKEIHKICNLIESEKIEGKIKILFENLKAVATADSDVNPGVNEKNKVKLTVKKPSTGKEKPMSQLDMDRRLIVDGVYHSMKKFDDIENYKQRKDGGIDTYINILTDEVKRHYIEEKEIKGKLKETDPIMELIKTTVKKIVTRITQKKPELKAV